jgi:hypothetical protein
MKNKYLLLLPCRGALEKKQQRSAAENATVYLHGSTQHAEYAAHIYNITICFYHHPKISHQLQSEE